MNKKMKALWGLILLVGLMLGVAQYTATVIMIIPITTMTVITDIPIKVTLMSSRSIMISANIIRGENITTIGINGPIV